MKVMAEVEVEEIAEQILKQLAESGDVIQVTRCKDCRHWWLPYGAECLGVCQLWDLNTDYDFFCKDGERESE